MKITIFFFRLKGTHAVLWVQPHVTLRSRNLWFDKIFLLHVPLLPMLLSWIIEYFHINLLKHSCLFCHPK